MYNEINGGIDTEMIHFHSLKSKEELEEYSFISTVIRLDESKGKYSVKLNLNKRAGRYYIIGSLSEFKEVLKEVKEIIGVEEIVKSRVDVFIDNMALFGEVEKLNTWLTILLGYQLNTRNAFKIQNIYDEETNSFWVKTGTMHIQIYDKKKESKGLHLSNTRVEFAYERAIKSTDEENKEKHYIEKTRETLKLCLGNWETGEVQKAEILYNKYVQEKEKKESYSFSEFVRHREKEFLTLGIFESVYKRTGVNMAMKRWLNEYRERKPDNDLKFITKKDFKEYVNTLREALKIFKNN